MPPTLQSLLFDRPSFPPAVRSESRQLDDRQDRPDDFRTKLEAASGAVADDRDRISPRSRPTDDAQETPDDAHVQQSETADPALTDGPVEDAGPEDEAVPADETAVTSETTPAASDDPVDPTVRTDPTSTASSAPGLVIGTPVDAMTARVAAPVESAAASPGRTPAQTHVQTHAQTQTQTQTPTSEATPAEHTAATPGPPVRPEGELAASVAAPAAADSTPERTAQVAAGRAETTNDQGGSRSRVEPRLDPVSQGIPASSGSDDAKGDAGDERAKGDGKREPRVQQPPPPPPPAVGRAAQVESAVRLEQATGAGPSTATLAEVASPGSSAPVPSPGVPALDDRSAGADQTPRSVENGLRIERDERAFMGRVLRGFSALFNQRGGIMTMRLEPAELGQLRVQMQLTQGTLRATLEASTSQARALLDQNLGSLRAALESHGLTVERLVVQGNGAGTRDEAGGHEDRQQARQDAGHGESRGRRHRDASAGPDGGGTSRNAALEAFENALSGAAELES